MFGWEFPPHIAGGLGTACYGLTKALAKQGVQVKFVVPRAYGDEDRSAIDLCDAGEVNIYERVNDLEEYWKNITYLEIGSNLIPYVSPKEFEKMVNASIGKDQLEQKEIFKSTFTFSGSYGKDLMQEVARYALIAAVLGSKKDFDVIHAHDWLTYPAGIAAKNVSGKPLVIHVHATEFDRSGENVNQSVFDIERKGMEFADKIITVSNYTRQIVIERYGIPAEKVVTVYNAVEPPDREFMEFKANVEEKIVTFLGRITFQKGPEYFVEAAHKILQKQKNVRFVMAGSGDMLDQMVKRVAKLGISDRFHFAGFLRGEEVDRMFAMSDIYVMPSVSEPFGISPLEAMRSNVPVIISKQSGVSEILIHAIKVDFWDIDAIADAIYGLLNYEALSKMFRRLGKDEVERLKWENSAVTLINIYQSLK